MMKNATTIMTERMIDLLTINTRIMDYVDSIGDIKVTTDFTYNSVEVKTDRFTITYFLNFRPLVSFDGDEFNSIDLSDILDMLNYNEEVDIIFKSVKEKYV
jgi:rRNA processing protein Krr1/Pno1